MNLKKFVNILKKQNIDVYENQGNNYSKYRPSYPQQFIQKISSSQYNNYLDLACGTGSVLYALAHCVNDVAIGVDQSHEMLQTARQRINNYYSQNKVHPEIKIIKSDVLQIEQQLMQGQKFDLITIGEALHWLDVDKFLEMSKRLLNKDGKMYVLGYFTMGLNYNIDDLNFKFKSQQHFDTFIKIIYPYFHCDRASLDMGYDNYKFNRFYKNAIKFDHIQDIELSVDQFLSFCKTLAVYNTCVRENKDQKDFIDPLETLQNGIYGDLYDIHNQSKSIKQNQNILIQKVYHFMWEIYD